ncbi:pleckstrin/ G-protein interacting- domain protein [Halothece sp. PCC 7418]|uniref:DEP domain-containing protein n=1 Tax=Halothece sp. (strain PCC 7418) TaxID=65093 RepID=UPI0002A07A94|nr:DEP domain-containing protein [Halothece sp. PCC 7418]AFZ43125.1 pleckstrin/ G-protein interacting- domain protein [Halothece sp. PCC 7418]
MLLLSADQVRYCQVAHQNQKGEQEVIPGIAYYGKLFLRGEIFPISQKNRAIEYSRQRFTEYEEQVYILIVEEADRLTLWYESSEVTRLASDESEYFSDFISSIDLKQLVGKMRLGLPTKTKRRGLRVFRDCFLAREAINWLEYELQISRADAIRLGQRLVKEDWIVPLTNNSLSFQDGDTLYNFGTQV